MAKVSKGHAPSWPPWPWRLAGRRRTHDGRVATLWACNGREVYASGWQRRDPLCSPQLSHLAPRLLYLCWLFHGEYLHWRLAL